jgi:hypothetical protein
MTELNRTHIPEKEWKAFITDIVAVQVKHGIDLVPTMKVSPVTGLSLEWGGIRKDNDTDKQSDRPSDSN